MNEAREKLDYLKKGPTIGQFVEYIRNINIILIGALPLILILQACGGGMPEPHQKYVGKWNFVSTDAKDGFFWAEKDIKTLTLDENGTWNLDGDKANGEWGMTADYWERQLEGLEEHLESNDVKWRAEDQGITEEQAKEEIKEEFFTHFKDLAARETHWKCNNAERVDMIELRIDTTNGKEVLVLKMNYRAFLNKIVDEGNGAELANRLSITSQKYYFER